MVLGWLAGWLVGRWAAGSLLGGRSSAAGGGP